MAEVFQLLDLDETMFRRAASAVRMQNNEIEVLVHPFSIGWDDLSVTNEIERLFANAIGGGIDLPHPRTEYARRNREYLFAAAHFMQSSDRRIAILFQDWEKKSCVLWKDGGQQLTPSVKCSNLLGELFPERSWLVVWTEMGSADPIVGWETVADRLRQLNASKLLVFGGILSKADRTKSEPSCLQSACVNTALQRFQQLGFEAACIEEACIGPF